PLQQLKQAIRAALSELRLLLPWARTGPAHRLRRVRPLALLLGVDADQHPLKASDRVIVRGHQLFELGPAALLRLALIPLLRKLGRCEFVTEGGHGVRLGRQMLNEDPQPPPRHRPTVCVKKIDTGVVVQQVGFYRLRVRLDDGAGPREFPRLSPERAAASSTNCMNSMIVGSTSR